MFQIVKHAQGSKGAFVKLVHLDSDDYSVIVRLPEHGRLHHKYIGPDWTKADEVFQVEASRLNVPDKQD
jgi:hypothetical protein